MFLNTWGCFHNITLLAYPGVVGTIFSIFPIAEQEKNDNLIKIKL